jgi:exopolysaccharide biosynthesis polyprenyl glycosylphosphotransferase
MKKSSVIFQLIKIPLDFILVIAAFISAYHLRLKLPESSFLKAIDLESYPAPEEFYAFSLYAGLALLVIFAVQKVYILKKPRRITKELKRIFIAWSIWVMLMFSYFFLTRSIAESRSIYILSWIASLLYISGAHIIIRIIQRQLTKLGIGKTNVLIIGRTKIAKILAKKLEKNPHFDVKGLTNSSDIQVIIAKIREEKIDQVIQTKSNLDDLKSEKILEFCEFNHIEYRFVPDLLEVSRTHVETTTISGIPIITMRPTPLDGWGRVVKRGMDIIGSALALIILAPVFLIIAIAIKLESKGPIFFTKLDDGTPAYRVGHKGKKFVCYKFRSMRDKSHELRYTELADKNIRKDGPLVKIKGDPRVTKVGRFIRRFSIDELPQLFNALIGNMSLIGPRPHLPEEVKKYEQKDHFAFTIKPGITGLPQISGRSDLSFEEKTKLDRFYIENWSIWLDLKILFKTPFVLLKRYEE